MVETSHTHSSHAAILPRLKRAEGHLRSVIGMIEQGKPCLDIAQQLHAVEAAIAKAKSELIHDHIAHCLEAPGSEGAGLDARAALAEMKQLAKYL